VAGATFVLGRLFGIRVGAHVSWLAVYAFVTFALSREVGLPLGAICALALFACVVAHELAHALAARRFGVRTEAITLFLFGGVATLECEPPTPAAETLIALAGPAMSALLALVAFGGLMALERFAPGSGDGPAAIAGAYLALANGVLAVFNLVPAYPMDGGRVLRALLWRVRRDRARATLTASRTATAFALLFVAAGVFVTAATHNWTYGWYVLVGAFLLRQGWSHERTARTEMSNLTGRDFEVGAAA
jgi:Zn-dependent protease